MGLGRAEIHAALQALGNELGPEEPVELFVVGGAAMVLLYAARESTRDVDAFLAGGQSLAAIQPAIAQVASRHGLPEDWLNDAAKGFVHGMAAGALLLEQGSLTVRALAPHQLLAMKLSAWRDDVDVSDARVLLRQLAGTRDEVWTATQRHLVPGRELKAQFAFADLWESEHGPR